jgi:GFO/IDH/MocA oxidoreductase family protein
VTSVLLVGAGATGVRAARQLVDTAGLDRLLVADRDPERARSLAEAIGATASTAALDEPFPTGVDAVALAIPSRRGAAVAERAVDAGVPVAAVADERDGIAALLGLDPAARAAGVMVLVGCGLVPGLGDVLARHAADSLDEVDEAHVARVGAAGPACLSALRRARREPPLEWVDNTWHTPQRRGHELVWFPDPVDARECEVVAPGVELLRDSVPGLRRATVRVGDTPVRRASVALVTRRPLDDGWGGARVEVWGWRGTTREAIVYGVIERPAVAAGTVLAVSAACLAGLLPAVGLRSEPVGARALGGAVDPAAFLGELARRGVKAAVFEGVGVA